jgi:hypothetical protein
VVRNRAVCFSIRKSVGLNNRVDGEVVRMLELKNVCKFFGNFIKQHKCLDKLPCKNYVDFCPIALSN